MVSEQTTNRFAEVGLIRESVDGSLRHTKPPLSLSGVPAKKQARPRRFEVDECAPLHRGAFRFPVYRTGCQSESTSSITRAGPSRSTKASSIPVETNAWEPVCSA